MTGAISPLIRSAQRRLKSLARALPWMVIDVDTYERALELAGELSAAPGAGGRPIHEWLEVRPFGVAPPTITE